MEEAVMDTAHETSDNEAVLRVYEIGYHVSPANKEDEVDGVVAQIRSLIEKAGGSFIAEGAPSLVKLAYPITANSSSGEGKRMEYDRGYFGWIKFEAPASSAQTIADALRTHGGLLRSIVFQTVREETRARFKAPSLREVKRTDTLKAAPRATEEVAAPVSEEDLEKAIEGITAE